MKRTKLLMVAALALVICLPGMAMASFVGPFAGTVESFEGVAPGTPANGTGDLETANGYYNTFTIGHGAVTTFASGVTFTAPIIASGNWNPSGDPFISDFFFSAVPTNNWNYVNITPADVPGGTAWAGTFGDYKTPVVLEFTLPALQRYVGAYVDGAVSPITMTAYDAAGNWLATEVVGIVSVTLGRHIGSASTLAASVSPR